jgi:hypothetical protein
VNERGAHQLAVGVWHDRRHAIDGHRRIFDRPQPIDERVGGVGIVGVPFREESRRQGSRPVEAFDA